MTQEDLSKLHGIQLSMLDEIHKICVNNKLTYYIIAGTCLGAIRHKGFIPWDIDIDLAMPREDYEKFINIYYKQLPSNLICQHYKICHNFTHPHALICLKNSVLYSVNYNLNPTSENLGIYIDLFPLDQCPNDRRLQQKQAKEILRMKRLRYRKVSLIYQNDKWVNILIKKFMRLVLKVIPFSYLNQKNDNINQKYNSLTDSKYLCSMTSGYSYEKQRILKTVYGTPKEILFDGHLCYAPENCDAYLKHLYGDYMKIPSIEEQEKLMKIFVYASWYENNDIQIIKSI